jgi:hypothetical protein
MSGEIFPKKFCQNNDSDLTFLQYAKSMFQNIETLEGKTDYILSLKVVIFFKNFCWKVNFRLKAPIKIYKRPFLVDFSALNIFSLIHFI